MNTWGERVEAARRRAHVARSHEESLFAEFLKDPAHRLLALHGIPGSGKTALLRRFAEIAPPPVQLLRAGAHPATPGAWSSALDREASVILLDDFHLLLPIFTYVLSAVLPRLGDHQKLVVASRTPLPASMLRDPGWASIASTRRLGPMTQNEGAELLARAGVPAAHRAGLYDLAAGHPLALRTMAERWDGFDWGTEHEVRQTFLAQMLEGVTPSQRRILEVAALNLVATPELIERIDPGLAAAFHATSTLSLVSSEHGGLRLEPAVREPLVQELTHTTPDLRDSILRTSLSHAEDKTKVGPRERRVFWATNSVELIGRALNRGSSLTSSGWTKSAVRKEHVEAIVDAVRHQLGDENARLAGHWLSRRPRGASVAWDPEGLVAYTHFLDLDQLSKSEIEADPAVHAFAQHAEQEGVARARVARFYLPFTKRGLPFVVQETTARLLFGKQLELAGSAQPDRFLEQYRELGSHPKVAHLSLDAEAWSISCQDLRNYSPIDLHRIWSQLCQADPSLLGGAPDDVAPRPDVSPAAARADLRRALRSFHDASRLTRSPLASSRPVRALVASGEAPDTAQALRVVLRRLVSNLGTTGEDGRARRVLETTYFREPRKQLAIAKDLGVGESTYRRHLKLALERLEVLWEPSRPSPRA